MINKLIILKLIFTFIFFYQQLYCSDFSAKFVKSINRDDLGRNILSPIFLRFNPFDHTVYLIDAPKSRIIFFNENFFPYFSVGVGRGIKKPISIAFSNNEIYVCEQKQLNKPPEISVFSNAWRKKRVIILSSFDNASNYYPNSLAVNSRGNIYIVSQGTPGFYIFTNKGRFIKKVVIKDAFFEDEKPFEIKYTDIFIDKNDRIYALSEEIGRLYVFSKYNNLLFKAGKKGGTRGKLSRPRGVAVDVNKGLIFVVDYMRQIVQCFDYSNGKFLFEFGGYGVFYGYFNYPTSVTVDENGYVYVADMFNSRVQVFSIQKTNQ